MAITVSSPVVDQNKGQFQGMYNDMWQVSATLSFAAIAAGAEDSGTITVKGVSLGDHVLSYGFNTDPEVAIFNYGVGVSAANTITLSATNMSGVSDTPTPTEVTLLVGKPAW